MLKRVIYYLRTILKKGILQMSNVDNTRTTQIQGMDEILQLDLLFGRARYLSVRAREKELQRYGLTPEQVHALFTIQRMGNKGTQSEIGRELLREPHTIADMVNRMALKGLVVRMKDAERKNLVRVGLTEEGKKALKIAVKAGPIRRIIYCLNEKERQQFRGYLERLMAKAEEELGMDQDNLPPSEFKLPEE
jgi:DNA-binding MarR family transcriptional regulator